MSSTQWSGPYGPVGTILAEGSTDLQLTDRERRVAELIASGHSYKVIAKRLGMPIGTVATCMKKLASRIPSQGSPRQRVSAWMMVYSSSQEAAVGSAEPYTASNVLGPGSTGLLLTERERQVAELVAVGFSYRRIAHALSLAGKNSVGEHVAAIARRIPGQGSPQQRVSAWMWCFGTAQGPEG